MCSVARTDEEAGRHVGAVGRVVASVDVVVEDRDRAVGG